MIDANAIITVPPDASGCSCWYALNRQSEFRSSLALIEEISMPADANDFVAPLDESSVNPYRAPLSEIGGPREDLNLDRLASGQRMINYALLIAVMFYAFIVIVVTSSRTSPRTPSAALFGLMFLAWFSLLFAMGMGIVGFFRMAAGLGTSLLVRLLLVPLMLIPLVSLLILVLLNARATRKLRAAGYHVGFLGAKRNP